MGNKVTRLMVLSVFLTLFIGIATSAVVTNSQDWTDVQAAMQYADENDETPYFTRTVDGSAVLNDLPIGVNATVVQSSQNSYLPNLDAQIRTRDYNYQETISFAEGTELVPDDVQNFVVISRDRPSDVIVASPLANAIEGWVLVVDDDNLDQIEQQLEGADQVIKVGQFQRDADQVLDQYTTETITGQNRFDLSTKIADRINEETEVESVKLSGGRYLESSVFTDSTPVLLTGTNFLAEETRNYILNSSSIGGVIAIGAELGTVAEELDNAADERENDVSVYVKYGQATMGGSRQVQALSLFPLPTPSMDLSITAAQYVVGQDTLLATLRNPSDVDGYALNSIVIKDGQGQSVATVGDNNSRFIPADSSQVFAYDLDITEQTALAGQAEFTTNYGTTPNNLDTFVDSRKENVFGPPRVLPISTINLDDDSNLNITSVVYSPEETNFNVTVSNGDVQSYARVDLRNVVIDGLNTTLSTDVSQLEADETAGFIVDANLSREDIQDTGKVTVNANYGERESFLINTESKQATLQVATQDESELLSDDQIIVILIVLVLLIIVFLIYELIRDEGDQ